MKRSLPWILALFFAPQAALAQYDQSQLVQPPGVADLNANLSRLAANPRDVTALIGAGEAALVLDDARAAAGFFARADAIESGNGRIKAGLARVNLKMQNPAEALRLFDQASRLGYPDATILADRGLARDMTGDQTGAQRDYQAAIARTPNDDELVRRYAASLGISGQVDAAERVLKPLLYKSDRAAWRYRAFIYAMNNRQTDAQKVASDTMPAQLAAAIVPYMQKMPYLTAAQKAAAVHFGHFPAQVGSSIVAIVPTPAAPGGPAQVASAVTAAAPVRVATREDRRSRRQRGRSTQMASADGARTTPGRTPVRAETPRAAEPEPVPPPPRPTTTFAASRPVVQSVPATPSSAPASTPTPSALTQPTQSQPTQSQPTQSQPAQSQAAASSAQPSTGAVAGPPQPGFDTLAAAPARSTAPAPVTSQPGTASQLNAITLAQASAPKAAPAPSPLSPAAVDSAAPATPPTPSSMTAPSSAMASAPATIQPTPPAATPAPNPEATRSLADIIRAIDVPESERRSTIAAVDLTEIAQIQAARRAEKQTAAALAAEKAKKAAVAKAKAEADAKAKAEADEKKRLASNPARNWVQIGVGRQRTALGFTFKAMKRKYADIAPQQGWVANWGQTNRLLIGPFASFSRARSIEETLKAAGADAFAWQSDAGEVVERLGKD